MSKKVLILGASSYIGRHLFARLGSEKAIATYLNTPIKEGFYFDPLTMKITDVVREPGRISHAVILFGITRPNECARNEATAYRLNVTATCSLIEQLETLNIVPIFASTESVFDGTRGNYVETDPPTPILAYGAQKVEVENAIQSHCSRFLIVRLSTIFGASYGDGTLLTQWVEQIENNQNIRCASDHVFSPLYIGDCIDGLQRLISQNHHGIFHLSGPEALSRFEMLSIMLKHYQPYRPYSVRIEPCFLSEFPVLEPRPLNCSLCSDKIRQMTGLTIMNLEESCRMLTAHLFGVELFRS